MQLDDRVTLATPEGVALELVLAGLGSRFLARLLDSVIQFGAIIALAIGVGISGDATPGFVQAGVFVLVFLVVFAYDVAFETLNHGRTIGKLAAGIRVVGEKGEPVRFLASAIRNIVRILDFLPVFYLIGTISIIATERDQRLGDLAGGTLVMRDKFPGMAKMPAPITVSAGAVATWDVSAIGPGEIQAVRRFLDRRLELTLPARNYFAYDLANRLGPRVAGIPPYSHPEYVLEGIVVAKQGRSRRSNFDPRGDLRIGAGVLLGAAAIWPILPVHPPIACPMRTATGIPCPLCGMTRACVAAVHGHLGASLAFNPAGLIVLAIAITALFRPQLLTRARPPTLAIVAAFGALWLWNVGFNPTFHQLLLR